MRVLPDKQTQKRTRAAKGKYQEFITNFTFQTHNTQFKDRCTIDLYNVTIVIESLHEMNVETEVKITTVIESQKWGNSIKLRFMIKGI